MRKIKIDQQFVRDILVDADDAAIVRAILALARALKLRAVAEGVTEQEQLAFLQAEGCDEAQGYFFSSALIAAGTQAYLQAFTLNAA